MPPHEALRPVEQVVSRQATLLKHALNHPVVELQERHVQL
jgi:hypothetical protein